MKFGLLVLRVVPLIVVFSCRDDDITAPVSRSAVPSVPSLAVALPEIRPSVSAGAYHACALGNDGSLACWGYNPSGQSTPPTDLGPVVQVSNGAFHTCALKTDATVACWGFNGSGQRNVPSTLTLVSEVSAGVDHTCAVRRDGTVVCWGIADLQTQTPTGLTNAVHISSGAVHNCVLRADNTVICWGANADGETTVPADLTSASQVSVADRYSCALKSDGTVRCWGLNSFGQATPPASLTTARQISTGYDHACALRADNTIVCWGNGSSDQLNVPAGLTSMKVSSGAAFNCALTLDANVACWGNNSRGQTTVPAGLDLTLNTQAITFTATPPSPAVVGATYTVSATGGASGNPVTFTTAGTETVCSVSGNAVSLLSVGSCTISADQTGNAQYLAAPTQTQTFDVVAVQEIQFTTTPPDPAIVGTTQTLSATGGGSGNPVTFSSLSQSVCTVSGSTAILIDSGTCTIVAEQNAGNGYLAADPSTLTFVVVAPIAQTITFTALPPSPALVGHSYTITATGGASGNPIVFNSATPTVCVPFGNTVNLLRIGTCRITADQNGNALYLPAAQQVQIFDVNDVQTVVFTSSPPSPAVAGNTYVVAATGGLSGNPVTFTTTSDVCLVDGRTVSLRHAGTCTIAADQAAGGGYLAAPQRLQTFTVIEPIPQIVAFTSSPAATPIVGGTYSLTATGGGSGNPVLFSSSTPTICFVTGSTVNLIARGTCHIAADQDGNTVYLAAAQKTQTFDIFDVQAISFTSTPPAPGVVGGTYTISAIGGLSGNSVTFSSLSTSVCSVSGHTVTLTAAGDCVVAADQAAGGGYLAAPRATQTFQVIQPLPQTITITSTPPSPAVVGATYTVAATGGGSGNPVLFSSSPTSVCFMVGNTVTFRGIGTCHVTADQVGNLHYFAATQQQQIFDVFDVQAIAFTSTTPDPGVVGTTYSVAATGGLSGNPVTFSSLSGVVCTVSGNTVTLRAAGTCIVAADQASGAGYLAAAREVQSFTVIQPQPQSISFTSSAPNPGMVGGSYQVTATGGASGNAVVFTSLTPSVCDVSGHSTIGLNARGNCTIAANQAGNTLYATAGQVTQSFDIYDVQAITFSSTPPDPAVSGTRYEVSATGGASGNPVTFSSLSGLTCIVSGSIVTFTNPGTCIIAADQAGGNFYLQAPRRVQSFAVQANQTISFTSTPPNPARVGGSYTISASGGASGNPVLFSSLTPSVCYVLGNSVSLNARGTCRVAADQNGNASYLSAAQQVQVFDIYDLQSIVFTSAAPAPGVVGNSYLVTASGGLSGNPVAFSSLNPSVCTVVASTASLIAAGTCIIAADQHEGNGYLAAAQQTQSFTVVQPIAQTINFTSSPPNPAIVGGSYSLSATGGASGNSVRFTSLTPSVCSVIGSDVSLRTRGLCEIAANQAGNTFYLIADQTSQRFDVYDVQAITFTSVAPAPGIVGGTYAISASGGASGSPVTFRSLSTGVCSVNDATASFTSPGTCIIAADQAAGNGYLAAPSQTQNVAVAAAQLINFTSAPPSPAVVGGTYSVSAAGGASGNPVLFSSLTPSVCFVLGNSVSLNVRGSCRVAADQTGSTFYLPAVQQVQVFDIYDVQAITFTSTPPDPAVVGNSYSISAIGGLSGSPVTFSSLSPSVCSVTGRTASLTGPGSCTIAADQAEGSGYLAAPRKTQSFTVIQPIAQRIAFTSTPPTTPIVGGAYTVTANGGGSGIPVVFSSLTAGTCAVSGAMVSFTARGICTIAANQGGDAAYLPAGQVTQSLSIDTRPVANAGAAQTGNEGSAVTFNGSGSSDADGDALTYRWDFGDGTTQSTSSPTVQHVYADNGTYVVTLMVTDVPGATSAPATTSAVIGNIAPTASIEAASPLPEGAITVSLTSLQDAAGDLSTLQYAFDCGNGTGFGAFGSSPTVSCYGWDNGTLTVRAQVRDKDGQTSPVYSKAISLVNVAPTVTVISAPATGSVGVDYTVQYKFTDPGTKDSPWYYQPNWGDGKKLSLTMTSTQGQTITQRYRYTSPGTYTVILRVIDKDGASGSTSFQVTIR